LDAASQSLAYLERELKSLEGERTFTDRISLDLAAEVQELQIKNSLAELSAAGAINVTGTPSLPELNGNIRTQSGGTINLGRAQVRIIEGHLALAGFPDNPPDVSLRGITSVRGVTIELNVRGQTDNLQTQLSAPSRSDLTQGDLVLLIMTGRTAAEVGSSGGAIVAEALAADLGEMLQERTGDTVYIDVAPDPSYFSSDSDPTTRFSLGTQVVQNLFVIYSTALNGEQQRGIVNFEPDQPFWFRYIIEEDGRNIIEVNHRLQINLRPKKSRSQVESEDQTRIKSLFFQGDSPLTDKELQKLSRLKPGKDFEYWKALQGAERIQKKLVNLGYRSALVEFEERPSDSRQVEVVYSLRTGKLIHIVWSGNSLGGGFKKNIEAFWDAHTPEDELSNLLARQTEYALKADRFYQAKVFPSLTKAETEISVQLNVQKSPRGQNVIVLFDGNDSLSDTVLLETLPNPETSDFFEMIDRRSGMIRRRIHLLYASHGFIKARVKNLQTNFLEDSQEFQVNISIEEGQQALIASVTLPVDLKETTGSDKPQLNLRQDFPFQLDDYLNDRSALRDFYSQQGFFQPRVSGMLKPIEDKIAVSFAVTKGPRARVGNIRKARPGRTRLSRIQNTMSLKEGDLILPREIARSRQRFIDTQAYRSVDIQLAESEEGPHIRDIIVDLVDKPEIELNYGLRYTLPTPGTEAIRSSEEYSAFEVGGRLEFLNPFGYGRRFGASGYLFGREQFLRLFMESESFFGYRIPTQVYISHTWKPELIISGIQSRINKITFQQFKRWRRESGDTYWADKLRLQWNYSFRHIQITSTHASQESAQSQPVEPIETDRGSISLALLSDSRDSFIDPTRGFFGGISSEFARQWLGSDVNYNKLYFQAYFYMPLAKDIIWASGLRVGAIPGENPFLILEDRFRTGGPYSVRGFPVYYLGPKNEKGEPLGGQAVFIFNQELRFPIYKLIHGGIFYDAGNVFALANQMSLSELRHCAGAGIRLVLPFGPIRLDWAYVLDPQPEEKRSQIYFSIGHAF
jgi:outer membrane protein assembly complex protein YaeT